MANKGMKWRTNSSKKVYYEAKYAKNEEKIHQLDIEIVILKENYMHTGNQKTYKKLIRKIDESTKIVIQQISIIDKLSFMLE